MIADVTKNLNWIAVDWGTSRLRLWLMDAAGKILDHRTSDQGMASLSPDGFEPALLALLGDALPENGHVPVICCGMAGSRQGWAEAPYVRTPCAPPSIGNATQVATGDPRLQVFLLPGLEQQSPADVMRGEETQIAGFLSTEPDFDGVLCLPGTHCKWAHISAGEVVSFRTFMTGELFALLSGQSVLRHSVSTGGWDDDAFRTAVGEAMARPAAVSASLFSIRAESLLNGMPADTARARLSGLLLGLELGGARPYWLGRDIAVLGESGIAAAYCNALAAQAAQVRSVPGQHMTLNGLRAARAHIGEFKP
ncbi:2-dehydro-3-deoxygalactonokinase [Sedimentitalea nanhaiensis]|uniref:2-dehydro-3-deoxygalactonokinase n=1 Tax=Sedimentitalea nanhaiensis TaxID=999627 RepID=A0A1I7BYF3_9RHOB|nr:2-dehydro-3-deoxygalactonokinase [Sedimentitalea nanhaiensis]SFT92223.1 2-dehydro-3-deoxygalactonokinase [Sedimentitalea nanhaiensis]